MELLRTIITNYFLVESYFKNEWSSVNAFQLLNVLLFWQTLSQLRGGVKKIQRGGGVDDSQLFWGLLIGTIMDSYLSFFGGGG